MAECRLGIRDFGDEVRRVHTLHADIHVGLYEHNVNTSAGAL